MLTKDNEILAKVQKNLNACEDHSIQLYFDSNRMTTADVDQITEVLTNLTFRDIGNLFEEMDLCDISTAEIDFKLDELMVKTESLSEILFDSNCEEKCGYFRYTCVQFQCSVLMCFSSIIKWHNLF